MNRVLLVSGMLILLISIWQAAVALLAVPIYVLPAPAVVLKEFAGDAGAYLANFGITLGEALLGLTIAFLLSSLLSVLLFVNRPAEIALLPLVVGFKAVPLVALAPLMTLWFGNGTLSKAIMAATICFFPIITGYLRGFRSISDDEFYFVRSFELSKTQDLWKFRFPKSLPYLFSGLRVAAVLSAVGAIVAEFTGAYGGLGYVVLTSSLRLEVPRLMVGIVLSAVCGLVIFALVSLLESISLKRLCLDPLREDSA